VTRVALQGGYYVARNLIASAQRCLNLYCEANPEDAPVPFTDYPTPGSRTLGTYTGGGIRCTYVATNGQLFIAAGNQIYYVNAQWTGTLLGELTASNGNMVSMADNGTTMIIVDGSDAGFSVDLGTHAFAQITDDAFYGGNRVDFLSTYFLLNKPGTGEFYSSDSNAITFDPLYFATKITYADLLASLIVLNQEIWLIGAQESIEVWINAGNPDFPFQQLPSVLINHGLAAVYSLCKIGSAIFWLSRDLNGQAIMVLGRNYQGVRISTFAVEAEWATYATVSDAVSCTYQSGGHEFVIITFPTADKTWVWDNTAGFWHERCWVDTDGMEHRVRGVCMAFAYGLNVAGDYATGTLRALDATLDSDDGVPMKFVRGFPHMISDGDRLFYRRFISDMSVGEGTGTLGQDPLVSLRWSDTRGYSWGNPITGSTGAQGEFLTQTQFQRLGMARDRVFELSWSGDGACHALNGAFAETTRAGT
jgi:hypothetical protein